MPRNSEPIALTLRLIIILMIGDFIILPARIVCLSIYLYQVSISVNEIEKDLI